MLTVGTDGGPAMKKPLAEYGERVFAELEVREKLSEVIATPELLNKFADDYSSSHAHLQGLFYGQHDGDEWEQWEYLVEDSKLTDGEAIVEAGRVVWNNFSDDLDDEVIDARLAAVIVHSLVLGFDNGWVDLYSLLDSAVDEDIRKYDLARDVLTHPELETSVNTMLSWLKEARQSSVIDRLMPLVETYAEQGNQEACRRMRDFNVAKKNHNEIMRWTRVLQAMR